MSSAHSQFLAVALGKLLGIEIFLEDTGWILGRVLALCVPPGEGSGAAGVGRKAMRGDLKGEP